MAATAFHLAEAVFPRRAKDNSLRKTREPLADGSESQLRDKFSNKLGEFSAHFKTYNLKQKPIKQTTMVPNRFWISF